MGIDDQGGIDGREREIKFELTDGEQAARLADKLPSATSRKRQVNHYYDYPDRRLREAGIMLRIRVEHPDGGAGRARLTMKQGARKDGAGLFDVAESEIELPLAEVESVLAGETTLVSLGTSILSRIADRFGDLAPLVKWGTLENLRSVHPIGDGLEIELDQATYPDGTVLHEVELESDRPEVARRRVIEILEAARVAYSPSQFSKSERLAAMG